MAKGICVKIWAALSALVLLAAPSLAAAKVPELPPRMVIIGDAHGDYDQYFALLLEAELITPRGSWAGGKSQLVQLGDVTDRGPDSRKIIDLIRGLERQAPQKGGAVHFVIGNHEAMNIKGDLRYVHAGEYQAFVTERSEYNRDEYFKKLKKYLKDTLPAKDLPTFDDAYRSEFDATYPLGWVEHRKAWEPEGRYGSWVIEHDAVLKVGNYLFVHGGISPKYATTSRDEINRMVKEDLASGDMSGAGISNEEDGPLWYRGLAQNSGAEELAHVNALLDFHGVKNIFVGHTPLAEAIVPRFGGKVIVADVGLSAHYGSAYAFVESLDGTLYAVQRGQRMLLPMEDGAPLRAYLELARSLEESPDRLNGYIASQFPAP